MDVAPTGTSPHTKLGYKVSHFAVHCNSFSFNLSSGNVEKESAFHGYFSCALCTAVFDGGQFQTQGGEVEASGPRQAAKEMRVWAGLTLMVNMHLASAGDLLGKKCSLTLSR